VAGVRFTRSIRRGSTADAGCAGGALASGHSWAAGRADCPHVSGGGATGPGRRLERVGGGPRTGATLTGVARVAGLASRAALVAVADADVAAVTGGAAAAALTAATGSAIVAAATGGTDRRRVTTGPTVTAHTTSATGAALAAVPASTGVTTHANAVAVEGGDVTAAAAVTAGRAGSSDPTDPTGAAATTTSDQRRAGIATRAAGPTSTPDPSSRTDTTVAPSTGITTPAVVRAVTVADAAAVTAVPATCAAVTARTGITTHTHDGAVEPADAAAVTAVPATGAAVTARTGITTLTLVLAGDCATNGVSARHAELEFGGDGHCEDDIWCYERIEEE
jgi:hypothetical protein